MNWIELDDRCTRKLCYFCNVVDVFDSGLFSWTFFRFQNYCGYENHCNSIFGCVLHLPNGELRTDFEQ